VRDRTRSRIFAVSALSACAIASCRAGYEAPCTAAAPKIVLSAPAGGAVTIDDGAVEGTIVVTLVHPEPPDPDAGVARVPGLPASVEVVVFAADQTIASRESFDAPDALRARNGSTGSIGATWNGEGVIFSWVETTTRTAPDGVVTSSAALRAAFVGRGGTKGPVVTPASGTCTACRLLVATAGAGGITAAVLLVLPDGTVTGAATPPPVVVRFASDGTIASEGTPSFLGEPRSGLATTSSGVASENGLFFFFDGNRATITDPSLAIMVGPVVIPNGGNAAVDWDPASRELEIGWASNGGPDGGAGVGVGPDILLQRLASDGTPRTPPERITTGEGVMEMRRRDGRVGTLVTAGGRDHFVLADESGKKIGGDVDVGAHPTVAPDGPVSAIGGTGSVHRLFALGGGRYLDWAVTPRKTTTQEISCGR
jgi:hypothetical protein